MGPGGALTHASGGAEECPLASTMLGQEVGADGFHTLSACGSGEMYDELATGCLWKW